DYVQFGTDLLSEQHDDLIPFRDGSFMSPTISAVDGKFYDSTTGLEIDQNRMEEAINLQGIVENKLMLSDKVVNGDLLRFYTPENFTPIDRTQYNYNLSPISGESKE
ncbi:glycerol phosphate lipoteichoic acid synthase, partial [Neobacillus vireti]